MLSMKESNIDQKKIRSNNLCEEFEYMWTHMNISFLSCKSMVLKTISYFYFLRLRQDNRQGILAGNMQSIVKLVIRTKLDLTTMRNDVLLSNELNMFSFPHFHF